MDAANPLFLMEFLVFNGAALGWAGYELWSLRREREKDAAEDAAKAAAEAASKESARHPEG
jgi:hypothetical protein